MNSNTPTWLKDRKAPIFPSLKKSTEADVCIIGGGLTGLLCAYRLSKTGKRIVLLEKDKVGDEATGMTTAFITQAIDTGPEELISMFGQATAKLVWQSGAVAIDEIEKIVKRERIACQFMRCPAIIYPASDDQVKEIRKKVSALGRIGIKGTMDEDHFILPRQAKFHPIQFLDGLSRRLVKNKKVRIFEGTRAKEVLHDQYGVTVVTDHNLEINCKDVVIATYHPLGNPWDTFLKKGMYKTFVMELRLNNPRPEGLHWDLSNPYHYYRVDHVIKGEDRMILGGADVKDIFPINRVDKEKQFDLLINHLEDVIGIKDYKIISKWTGPILEPTDGLPLIGRYKNNHYVACAFSGNGMTYAMISSMIITDQIFNKQNPFAEVYDPERIPSLKQLAHKAEDYIEELGTAVIKPRITKMKKIT